MKFIVDAQLPITLGNWIAAQGHEADHVAALGLRSASDQAIWDAATAAGAVILTKDHDFVEWATTRRRAPQVVWVRFGNCSTTDLIARLQGAWEKVVENLEAGVLVVEAGNT